MINNGTRNVYIVYSKNVLCPTACALVDFRVAFASSVYDAVVLLSIKVSTVKTAFYWPVMHFPSSESSSPKLNSV